MYTGMPNFFEERTQRHAFAERREVGQITADDAVRIVGRAGECETDGYGFFGQTVDDGLEPFDHRREAFVEVLGMRREGDRLHNEFVGLHGAENEVRAAGVEGDDHPVVMAVHIE